MAWNRFRLRFWRRAEPQPGSKRRRRRSYQPDSYGHLPGLIVNLKKDETRDRHVEETQLQSIVARVTNQPAKPGKASRGSRRVALILGQLGTDRPIHRTGGAGLRPMRLFEAGISLVVVAFLVSIFFHDLSAFLGL